MQLIPDVEAFAGHIACSGTTRSELVLPVFDATHTLLGVFDIDSDHPDAFEDDAKAIAAILQETFARA